MRQDRLRNNRRIQEAAVQLIARHGVDGVSFEELAREAEVSRGTLYNHYGDLNEVIIALARPVLAAGIAYFEDLDGEDVSIDQVLGVFSLLWSEFGESIKLIKSVRTGELEGIREFHHQFVSLFRTAPESIPSEKLPLGHDLSARVISATFSDLLESLDGQEEWEPLFLRIMNGALLTAKA